MRVLFAASEMAPFAKTGGLGDVVGSLPVVLREQGIDARVVIPHYSMIHGDDIQYRLEYQVPRRNGGAGSVQVHATTYQGVPVYFLKSYPYFVDDGKIYSVWDWDTPRFIYFSQMVMAFIWELAQGHLDDGQELWWPDVLHVHDWHTGLIPFLLDMARFEGGWNEIASVITLHNMAFQGPYASRWLVEEGIPNRDHPALPYQDFKDNLLGIGIAYANKINTVSPRHAIELHYPRFGEGLERVIWQRDRDFSGILNGIDMSVFNPATDKTIAQPFDVKNFRKKRIENKLALQREHHLEVNPDIPMIGLVSRMTEQKGLDFAIPGIREILATEQVQFVGLGTGDPGIEWAFGNIGLDFYDKARTYLRHDVALANQIYAASDMFLVPSRYEPCGLTQMIAMRYGSLPIVRETGGLADTVQNFDNEDGAYGTGFTFLWEQPQALVGTVRWALETYRHRKDVWDRMQERAMRMDWGWDNGAKQYIQLYEDAIAQKRAWKNG